MNDIKIELAKGLENIPAAQATRQKVFVEEQGFQLEFDGTDPIAWHAVLWLEQVPAATGRTFPSETEGVFTIGRIAVLPAFRGRDCGSQIVLRLEQAAQENGARSIQLCAQERALGFYEKLGYRRVGGIVYDESVPHVNMVKQLSNTFEPAEIY